MADVKTSPSGRRYVDVDEVIETRLAKAHDESKELLPRGLTIRDFQAISVKRALLWHKEKPWTPDEWLTAFIGELGEFANELKKCNRDRDGLNANNPRRVSLAKELADSFSYFVLLCNSVNVDLESETISVFNAISEREGFDIKINST